MFKALRVVYVFCWSAHANRFVKFDEQKQRETLTLNKIVVTRNIVCRMFLLLMKIIMGTCRKSPEVNEFKLDITHPSRSLDGTDVYVNRPFRTRLRENACNQTATGVCYQIQNSNYILCSKNSFSALMFL